MYHNFDFSLDEVMLAVKLLFYLVDTDFLLLYLQYSFVLDTNKLCLSYSYDEGSSETNLCLPVNK